MTQLQERTIQAPARPAISVGGIVLALCAIMVAATTFAGTRISDANPLTPWWPLVVLGVSLVLVITLITVVRLHALLALVLAAMCTGLMARVGSLPGEAARGHWLTAIELTTAGFGHMAQQIAIIIILASIIGICLLESGAADRIVTTFLNLFGEKLAGLALLTSTYIVAIPIFFDTIFMLLIPLAQALYRRTGRDYMLYVMAICCAAAISHSMIIPHPGPVAMAAALNLDAGVTIVVGLATGLLPLACGFLFSLYINRRMPIRPPLRAEVVEEADAAMTARPPLFLSLLPVILPVALIGLASTLVAFAAASWPNLTSSMRFFGDRNIALAIGAAIAIWLLMYQRRLNLREAGQRFAGPLETAGMIILITCAGGAFGLMLRNAGVGDAIKLVADGMNLNSAFSLIVLAWIIALVIRVAQGSATVAMLTTAGMVGPMMMGADVHPVCIFLAIGYGALGLSWMNDSGFWLVSRLGGFTEAQTLKSWTMLVTIISVSGLFSALGLAAAMKMLGW
jgi:gluconate:H+ symporter, GntP family